MGLRGIKPQGKVKIKWSAKFAYAIGLLVSDGCLYNDERHMSFVSKDEEQIDNFMKCLNLSTKKGESVSGHDSGIAYRVQWGDKNFYDFLVSIGITQSKSKTIKEIILPEKFFFDYLRGSFDGDGTFYSYWDKRWRSSHMFYLEFVSASRDHIRWLQTELQKKLGVKGHITNQEKQSVIQLKYAKKEALVIIKKMYYNPHVVCLSRKRLKIKRALDVEKKQQIEYSKV